MLTIAEYLLLFLIVYVVYLLGKTILFQRKLKVNPVKFLDYKNKIQFSAWLGLILVQIIYGVVIIMMYLGKTGETISFLQQWYYNLLGVMVTVTGLVMMMLAHAQMGKEWRMGFDHGGKIRLVQEGLFGFSRNPVYLATLMQALGMSLLIKTFAGWLLFLVLCLFFIVIIRTEERFLEGVFGEEYCAYKQKVRRFI